VRRSFLFDLGLLALTLVATLGTANATGRAELTAVVAMLGTAFAGSFSWGWLREADRQAALEVLLDHLAREQRLWVEATGTKLPSTVLGAERWLRANEGRPGTASILARLGRFDEARAAARSAPIQTPEDAFERDLIDRQLDLFEGRRLDTSSLHESWRQLSRGPVRDLRRWCLAILDAEQAVGDGRDGWPVLAAARADVEAVLERANAKTYARNLAILHVGVAALIWSIAAWAFL
jgi:hypothetical protein